MPNRKRLRMIQIIHDDGTGAIGPRGTPTPNLVQFTAGWADVTPRSGTDQPGLGNRLHGEQFLDIRGFRPGRIDNILIGMLVRWEERDWEIFSVTPVLRGSPGEVDIIALDKNTSRVAV